MSESPTGDATQNTDGLNNEPTEQLEQQPAESQNQETTSNEQSQEAVSDDESAQEEQKQTPQSGTVTDDGLAKFAKSQGIEDLTELSEREQKFLKIAHDNQRAARSNQPKVVDAAKEFSTPTEGATEVEKLNSKFEQLEYERQTDKFWSDDRNRELEPVMVQILRDKVTELTPSMGEAQAKAYVRTLSRDLDTLYGMASLKSGAIDPNAAKEEGRREAITSIKKSQTASAPAAHAVNQSPSTPKIDADWVKNDYDPKNPEHQKLMDSYMRGDLY